MRIWVPMTTNDFGAWLAYKYKAKFNYYIFVEGINVLLFIIFFLILAIVSILTYEPALGDVLKETKSLFLSAEFITILVTLTLITLISFLSKTKESLKRNLKILTWLTIIVFTILIGIKTKLDKTYAEDTFDLIYEEDITEKSDREIYVFSLLDEEVIKKMSEKDVFVQQSLKSYKYFNLKSGTLFIIILLEIVLEIYMLIKVNKKIAIEERLQKDDNILEDDEINVKY